MHNKLNYVQCKKKCIDVNGSGFRKTVAVGKGIRIQYNRRVQNNVRNPQYMSGNGLLNSINFAKNSKHIRLVY